MRASKLSVLLALLFFLAACTPPPAPARLSLHKDACQEPAFTPLVPGDEPQPSQIPVLAGGTVRSGDFLISLWLYCDPSLSSDDPNAPDFSEVRYLGFRSEWQYLGRPIDHMSRTLLTVNGERVSSSGSGPGVDRREINVHMGSTSFPGLADALRESRPVEFLITISAPNPLAVAALLVTFESTPSGLMLLAATIEERTP